MNKLRKRPGRGDESCQRCGNTSHDPYDFRLKHEKCRNCEKIGHIQKVCRSKRTPSKFTPKRNRNINAVDTDEENSSSDEEFMISSRSINNVSTKPKNNIIWIQPKFNDCTSKKELDTGSAVSILPKYGYRRLFPNQPLSKPSLVLKTYSGEKIIPIGELQVNVEHQNQKQNLDLYFVTTEGPPLFGRKWLRHITLTWKSIKALTKDEVTTETTKKLAELVNKYKEIFDEQSGT